MPGGVTRGKGPVLLAAWARRLAHTCPSLRIASSSTSVHTDFHSFFNDFHCFSMISIDFYRFLVSRSHPGVSGSFSEFQAAPGPCLGAQRRKNPIYIYYGSARHLYGLLSISTPQGNKFPLYILWIWAGRSHDWRGIFFEINSLIYTMDLAAPRRTNPLFK